MNVHSSSTYKPSTEEIQKKYFSLKPVKKDGLVLQIHHTITYRNINKRIRFLYSAFDSSGLIVANADINGSIFVFDFSVEKHWSLPKFESCSVLAFSPLESSDLIVGQKTGDLFIINVHDGTGVGILKGHDQPVKSISFANEQCLTSTATRAIIFNLRTFDKVHELSIQSPATLKQIFFMPVTNNIIACFSDDYIHVWKSGTFESYKKLLPTEWNNFFLKSIAVTRNGTTMVLAGVASKLIMFSLDNWTLTKILDLPDETTVKSADFVSQSHDGGANKFLILLTSNGLINFLDMEQNIVIAKIQLDSEIISFSSSVNGIHLACVLKGGEVNIYKMSHFIEAPTLESVDSISGGTSRRKTKLFLLPQPKPKEELNLNTLQKILKEYGEYPESYRTLIWTKILLLPNNNKSFTSIMKKGYNECFNNIDQKYPLVNKNVLKNLKRLLSNLGNWCPIFCRIDFLPLFVFPFVKVFANDPLICFEAVITIIQNWCQHWLEYTPCSPVNTLAMVENILAENDPQLLAFFMTKGVTSHQYAWSMLQTAFTEILTIKEWLVLWDHILSNEPALMLMVPVAYNILCRNVLGTLNAVEDFDVFYANQNPIGVKKLISKSYYLLNKTSEQNHPRKYLHSFEKLPEGSYPIFEDYCHVVLNLEPDELNDLVKTENEIAQTQNAIMQYSKSETERLNDFKIKEEETKRLQILEDLYQEKMLKEKERIDKRKMELSKLKINLMEMQAQSIENSRRQIEETKLNERKRELEKVMRIVEYNQTQDELEIQQTEEDLSKHYVELLQQKTLLENMIVESLKDNNMLPEKYTNIEKQREAVRNELEKIRNNVSFNRIINKVTIPIGISVANDITHTIDMAVAKEEASKKLFALQSHGSAQVKKMESDTKELENDVQNLLDKFTSSKVMEANSLLNKLGQGITDREKLVRTENLETRKFNRGAASAKTFPNIYL